MFLCTAVEVHGGGEGSSLSLEVAQSTLQQPWPLESSCCYWTETCLLPSFCLVQQSKSKPSSTWQIFSLLKIIIMLSLYLVSISISSEDLVLSPCASQSLVSENIYIFFHSFNRYLRASYSTPGMLGMPQPYAQSQTLFSRYKLLIPLFWIVTGNGGERVSDTCPRRGGGQLIRISREL